ncbi:MAG: aa3-type cytochrome c oxidase subunit IV [Kordiimonadaceae bacterium]|nr:aa3-type cytochrome c oxidase subunit IV [Kordiimonadaceae bacterium]
MDIEDQKKTYDGFIEVSIRATIIVIAVMAFLAAFVA